MEEQQTKPEAQIPDYYEDEIELMDLTKVIWKWKYLILAGTLIFAIGAAVISLNFTLALTNLTFLGTVDQKRPTLERMRRLP